MIANLIAITPGLAFIALWLGGCIVAAFAWHAATGRKRK